MIGAARASIGLRTDIVRSGQSPFAANITAQSE
jgi:hypothetical protein